MAYFAGFGGSVVISNSNGLPLSVNITSASGASVTVYSDAARTTAVTMPESISGSKTYYLAEDGGYVASTKLNGVEIGGQQGSATAIDLRGGCTTTLVPSIDPSEVAGVSGIFAGVGAGRLGNRVVAVGDSLTFNNSGGHFQQMAVRSAGRVVNGGWFATQGYTCAQILATHVPSVLALTGNQRPAACVVLAGTNDAGVNNGAGYVLSSVVATYKQIIAALTGAGILPVVCTVPPRSDFTAVANNVMVWNAFLRYYAQTNGLPLIDYHTQLVDPATGGWLSGQSADGIHPNLKGWRTMTQNVAATLAGLLPPGGVRLTPSFGDVANLLPTSAQTFKTDAGSGVATGWSNFSGGSGQVFSIVANDTSIAGNWQTLQRPQAATANAYLQLNPAVTTGFAVGDRIAMAARIQAANMETALNQSANVTLDFRDGTGATVLLSVPALGAWISDLTTTGVAYCEAVVPAGCGRITIGLSLNGAPSTTTGATVQVAQPTVLNLSTLGLA